MWRRNNNPQEPTGTDWSAVRNAAQRESYPYTDPRANYPTAEIYREALAEGVAQQQSA